MVIRSRRVQPSSTFGCIFPQISVDPSYFPTKKLRIMTSDFHAFQGGVIVKRSGGQVNFHNLPVYVHYRLGLVEFIATMPNREQRNYEDTKSFLEYYSDRGNNKLAKLRYTCLILNEALGLCVPSQPWCIDISGEGLQYQCMATLSLDAAIKAHFSLLAMKSKNSLVCGQMRFSVKYTVDALEQ
ncbi:hypothetical protein F5877DRAFT_73277 [Lentinula edodes]|nr:hypothetical protein F5877DRAFT_73277 [Lentinula edodes]